MPNLDGTDVIKPTAFDAHEQRVSRPHTYSRTEGYQVLEGERKLVEYPKWLVVGHDEDGKEIRVIAKDQAHERQLLGETVAVKESQAIAVPATDAPETDQAPDPAVPDPEPSSALNITETLEGDPT